MDARHPGAHPPGGTGPAVGWPLVRLWQRRASPEGAAWSLVFLAAAEEAASITGQYFESKAHPKRPPRLPWTSATRSAR
jgi:hypothetical protein